MRKSGFLLLFLLFAAQIFAHPWKPGHFVIIDTDGGIDDFRAISMMLASPDIRVLGITVTPGVLPASETYSKVKALLKAYYHEGIPVGLNENTTIKAANFEGAKKYSWGQADVDANANMLQALDVIRYIYTHSSDSIHFICLGSLNIVGSAMKIESFKGRTAEIIWSCSNVKNNGSFNYMLDKEAYKTATKLEIPMRMIDGASMRGSAFGTGFEEGLDRIHTAYAKEIKRSLAAEHKIYYDEIIPLWMHFPGMFTASVKENVPTIALNSSVSDNEIQEAYLKAIAGETINQNQVINFSWRKEDYFPDVQPIMDETIKKYGKAEWVAETMANELHRHLGVFAIVGTKMGIRAKEYFNAGIDEMKILSYAGSIPPFSCMNDGLQVSTGATVGHGLISVSPDTVVRPVADFTYMGRTIRLTLKPEYGRKIAGEVKELNKIYGLNSDIYWELIRKLAIKYWASFDRHEIFTIAEIGKVFNN
jgi:pyrimidine-specific ribonucleoside hydrolase